MTQVVIPCGSSKKKNAPTLHLNKDQIFFVADPNAPNQHRPWDLISPNGERTWLNCIADYNHLGHLHPEDIKAGVSISDGAELWCAGTLYKRKDYSELIALLGFENVFILSAGWGLIRSDCRIPTYDITFSTGKNVPQHAKISSSKRAKHPALFDPPTWNSSRVFMGLQYIDYLKKIIMVDQNIIEPCNGRRRTWYFVAAIKWINQLMPPPPQPPHNRPCPCNCAFNVPWKNCWQKKMRAIPIIHRLKKPSNT